MEYLSSLGSRTEPGLDADAIKRLERILGARFPDQVRELYALCGWSSRQALDGRAADAPHAAQGGHRNGRDPAGLGGGLLAQPAGPVPVHGRRQQLGGRVRARAAEGKADDPGPRRARGVSALLRSVQLHRQAGRGGPPRRRLAGHGHRLPPPPGQRRRADRRCRPAGPQVPGPVPGRDSGREGGAGRDHGAAPVTTGQRVRTPRAPRVPAPVRALCDAQGRRPSPGDRAGPDIAAYGRTARRRDDYTHWSQAGRTLLALGALAELEALEYGAAPDWPTVDRGRRADR